MLSREYLLEQRQYYLKLANHALWESRNPKAYIALIDLASSYWKQYIATLPLVKF